MLMKKYLGQIMQDIGFITRPQLEEALQKQKEIMDEKIMRERLQGVKLVTAARHMKDQEMAPLLGQILLDMGLVSAEQLERGLQEQEKSIETYFSMENRKLGVTIEIGSIVNSTLNLAEVLYLIMIHANRVTNSAASTLMLLDDETGDLVFSVPTGPREDKLVDIRIPRGEGIAGWVAENEQPVLVADVGADTRFYAGIDEKVDFETRSILCVPLKAKTKLIGVLEAINKQNGGNFTKEDELLLSMFGYQAAVAIENARLYSELREELTSSRSNIEALRESETKYRHLVEKLDDIIWTADLELRTTYVSQSIEKNLGFTPAERVSQTLEHQLTPESYGYIVSLLSGEMERDNEPGVNPNRRLRVETEFVHKNGSALWFENIVTGIRDDSGQLTGVHGVSRNITERKQAAAALRESEERYRSLVENTMDGYFICAIPSGRLLFLNQRACSFLERPLTEALELTLWDVIAPEEHPRIKTCIQARLDGTSFYPKLETYTAVRADGSQFRIEISTSVVSHGDGPALQGLIRDVTEKERFESQFQQAQKMEAIGTLAGGIAHDFNNLLMGIQGRASLLMSGIDASHPQYDHLAGIEQYVQSAADLTKQLLGFARGGKYEVLPTDLNIIVDETATMFGRTRKEIRIENHLTDDLWAVEVDRKQVEQILLNLFVNAWQAMPSGGTLTLETANLEIGTDTNLPFKFTPGRYVRAAITDTGCGMDDETRLRIFEPFFSTRERERGTGLGLASCYGIIKNHNGFIDVESEVGRGSTFNIYFPASDKQIAAEQQDTSPAITGKGNVLMVDDERMILDVCAPMLASLGYSALIASSGEEAIQIFRGKRDVIDLVVLDMIMPDTGGGEVFDQMKAIDPEVRVLLSSGYSIDGQATEIISRGCAGFIQKPFNTKQLSEKLAEILG